MPLALRPLRATPFIRCNRSWPPARGPNHGDPPPMVLEEGDGWDTGLCQTLEDALCAELRKRGCQVTEYPADGPGESLLRISGPIDWTRDDTGTKPLCDIGLYRVGLGGVLVYGTTAVAQMILENLTGKNWGPYDDPYDAIDADKRKEDPK